MTRNQFKKLDAIRRSGMADNTVIGYAKDARYFWAWARVAAGVPEAYPIPADLVERFIVDHLTGLSGAIDKALVKAKVKRPGVQTPGTIDRRVRGVLWTCRDQGHPTPAIDRDVMRSISEARRAQSKAGWLPNKKWPITKALLLKMIATCGQSIVDVRDRAVLEFGFFTGGRRRSEIAGALWANLRATRLGWEYYLHRSKTDQAGKGRPVVLRQKHGHGFARWIERAGIDGGPLFRRVNAAGKVERRPIDPATVAMIVKRRVEMIGENPANYGGHSLRRGFITECGRQGISIQDAMQASGHADVRTAMQYHEEGKLWKNPATKL